MAGASPAAPPSPSEISPLRRASVRPDTWSWSLRRSLFTPAIQAATPPITIPDANPSKISMIRNGLRFKSTSHVPSGPISP